jgi:hypothetical protein
MRPAPPIVLVGPLPTGVTAVWATDPALAPPAMKRLRAPRREAVSPAILELVEVTIFRPTACTRRWSSACCAYAQPTQMSDSLGGTPSDPRVGPGVRRGNSKLSTRRRLGVADDAAYGIHLGYDRPGMCRYLRLVTGEHLLRSAIRAYRKLAFAAGVRGAWFRLGITSRRLRRKYAPCCGNFTHRHRVPRRFDRPTLRFLLPSTECIC